MAFQFQLTQEDGLKPLPHASFVSSVEVVVSMLSPSRSPKRTSVFTLKKNEECVLYSCRFVTNDLVQTLQTASACFLSAPVG